MIKVEGLSVSFNGKKVLNNVNLSIEKGDKVVILGKSGSGKTVLLKSIAGLLSFQGNVKIKGKIGFVFQLSALFDSFTVYKNIALGLEEQNNISKEEIKSRVFDSLTSVGLEKNVAYLFPEQLSGGMKKLVAIARVIALRPDHIFYDEPTTGLDPKMSERIENLIKRLSYRYKVTSLIVTHDLSLAKKLGEKIFFLKHGRIFPVKDRKKIWELYE